MDGEPVDTQDDRVSMEFGDMEGKGLVMVRDGQLQLGLMSNGTSCTCFAISHVEADWARERRYG